MSRCSLLTTQVGVAKYGPGGRAIPSGQSSRGVDRSCLYQSPGSGDVSQRTHLLLPSLVADCGFVEQHKSGQECALRFTGLKQPSQDSILRVRLR